MVKVFSCWHAWLVGRFMALGPILGVPASISGWSSKFPEGYLNLLDSPILKLPKFRINCEKKISRSGDRWKKITHGIGLWAQVSLPWTFQWWFLLEPTLHALWCQQRGRYKHRRTCSKKNEEKTTSDLKQGTIWDYLWYFMLFGTEIYARGDSDKKIEKTSGN